MVLKADKENNWKIGIGDVTYYDTVHNIVTVLAILFQGIYFLFQIAGRTDVNAKYKPTRDVQVDKYKAVQGRFSM